MASIASVGGATTLNEDATRAEATLQHYIMNEPANGAARYNLAMTRFFKGDSGTVMLPLLASAALAPASWLTHKLIGLTAARMGRRAEAATAFGRAVELEPDNATLRYNLGLLQLKLGRPIEAAKSLEQAVELGLDTWQTHHNIALAFSRAHRHDGAVEAWRRALELDPGILLREKGNFYIARQLVQSIRERDGLGAACEVAIQFWQAINPAWPDRIVPRRPAETRAALAAACRSEPISSFDAGVRLLEEDRPLDALRYFADLVIAGQLPAEKYAVVIEQGNDAGHPLWHAMNPFYIAWQQAAAMPVGTVDVQDHWRTMHAYGKQENARLLEQAYLDWITIPSLARAQVRQWVSKMTAPLRVLDMGCGFGHWLRYLHDDCGVAIRDLFGCDFHNARVNMARALVEMSPDPDVGHAEVSAGNFFGCDALSWDPDAFVATYGRPNLVLMMSFISVFDDSQLDRVLARIAQLGPAYVVEQAPVDVWGANRGRRDAALHFARAGYRLVERVYPGEALTAETAPYIVLPNKYWVAAQLNLYERVIG